MSGRRPLLLGVAILGVFSAVVAVATNFQIYEVSAGNYVAAMWPTVGPATASASLRPKIPCTHFWNESR